MISERFEGGWTSSRLSDYEIESIRTGVRTVVADPDGPYCSCIPCSDDVRQTGLRNIELTGFEEETRVLVGVCVDRDESWFSPPDRWHVTDDQAFQEIRFGDMSEEMERIEHNIGMGIAYEFDLDPASQSFRARTPDDEPYGLTAREAFKDFISFVGYVVV